MSCCRIPYWDRTTATREPFTYISPKPGRNAPNIAAGFYICILYLSSTMDTLLQQIDATAAYLRQFNYDQARVGIVLGTGLGELVQHIQVEKSIPYHEIPHFPESTVESHKGQLIYGRIGNVKVIAM